MTGTRTSPRKSKLTPEPDDFNTVRQYSQKLFDVDATDRYCNNLFVPSATFEIHACDLQALWQEE